MAIGGTRVLLSQAIAPVGKFFSDFLVCPLSKQPLRPCPKTHCLISPAVGLSFPVVDGIPCLVPKDGKFVEEAGDAVHS